MSQVFGICMVKNAEDIIGYVVQHMVEQVDHVIVADNLSTDDTRNVLNDVQWLNPSNVTILDDNDPAYRQSEKMTELAMLAGRLGAEWVVPFDADEWWFSPHGRIRDVIVKHNFCINVAPMYDHVPTGVDGDDPNPMRRIAWRRSDKTPLHKVACRVKPDLTIEMGNHNATYTQHLPTYNSDLLEVRHFPYRTPEQFVEKAVLGAVALELTDLPYEMGQHWRDYARIAETEGTEALKDVFRKWFYAVDPSEKGLIFDPVVP